MIKSFILKVIGEENAGRFDYFLRRNQRDGWGPLNNQSFRQQVYLEIMARIDFRAIVETGTFCGTTTELFARSGLPVYSVEINPWAYGYALQRFSRQRDRVHLFKNDSVEFLKSLANDPDFPKSKVFFYLDAHVQDSSSYHEAPLLKELKIVFEKWSEALVMVDDFQVPGTDYGFDDWGPGRTLNMDYLKPLHYLQLSAFFPAFDPKQETGARRGWVMLCREGELAEVLKGVPTLTAMKATGTADRS